MVGQAKGIGTSRVLLNATVYASAALLLTVGGLILLAQSHVDWNTWRQASCMPAGCFCESIGTGTVRQPANAWSSLGFVLVSYVILAMTYLERNQTAALPNPMSQHSVNPVVYGAALFVVGIGSFFYHASLTFAGQFFDVFGMYLIGTFVLVYNLGRIRSLSTVATVLLYLSLNLVLATALYEVPAVRRYLFAALIVVALLLEYQVRRVRRSDSDVTLLVAAVVLLALAFSIWMFDITKVFCDAGSPLQGHALWHVLGACSTGLLFLFYRSEGPFAARLGVAAR